MSIIIEQVFSHAVSLEQSGRQRNMIFCYQNAVFILNYDKTVLLRFDIKAQRKGDFFHTPVGFFANDYDSDNFYTKEGAIVFVQKRDEFQREKKCNIPNQSFADVEEIFLKLTNVEPTHYPSITIQKASLDLFDLELSHIEFSGVEKQILIRQRDIYSGTLIELTRPEKKGFQLEDTLVWSDDLPKPFGPIGMRTTDFVTLFTFNPKVKLFFLNNFFIVEGKTIQYSMIGIVGGCLYDELGVIEDLSGGESRTAGKKLSSDPSVKHGEEDAQTVKPALAPRQTFQGLVPGTPEWKEYWENHPEEQEQMLEYKWVLRKELSSGRKKQEEKPTLKKAYRTNQANGKRVLRRRTR